MKRGGLGGKKIWETIHMLDSNPASLNQISMIAQGLYTYLDLMVITSITMRIHCMYSIFLGYFIVVCMIALVPSKNVVIILEFHY